MEIFRTAENPWGQNILVGVAWDLLWAALFAGVIFVVLHALYVAVMAPKPEAAPTPAGAAVPERVERHDGVSRAFHWLMAIAMFALLITAFFPLVGIQFAWVTIHWIAGIALTGLILWHTIDAIVRQDSKAVWIGKEEIAEAARAVGKFFRREPAKAARSGKYTLDQVVYHNAATIVSFGAIVTGLLMMFRIDTWFWGANPYFLSDSTWGLVFVLHGLCGVALITLVIAHVYFALRPEKRFMTRSMIRGWITRDEYLEHYDPEQWPPEPAGAPGPSREDASADPEAVAPA